MDQRRGRLLPCQCHTCIRHRTLQNITQFCRYNLHVENYLALMGVLDYVRYEAARDFPHSAHVTNELIRNIQVYLAGQVDVFLECPHDRV